MPRKLKIKEEIEQFKKTGKISKDKDVRKGSAGAYERYIDRNGTQKQMGRLGDKFDYTKEPIAANLDLVSINESLFANSQMTKAQALLGEAVEHLQGLQRDVYMLTMRQGYSISEAAKLLNLKSKSDAQGYKDRAVKFVAQYCQRQMFKLD